MKILFQAPTKGPLITVSFDDDVAAVTQAFSIVGASRVATAATEGLATLRTAAQFAQTAPGVASGGAAGGASGLGLAGIAGPAMLIGMFFAAGDAPPHKSDNDSVTPPTALTPNQLRCMADPYDTSAECAAVRSALSLIPFADSLLNNPNAARASASTSNNIVAGASPVDLPIAATPSSTPLLDAALSDNDRRELLFKAIMKHLPRAVGDIMGLLRITSTISKHQLWLDGLGKDGRTNFAAYQKLADQFTDPQQRLQFLASHPEIYALLLQYNAYPDAFFTDIRVSKKTFLDFVGFAAACKLELLSQQVALIEKELHARPPGSPAEITEVLIDFRDKAIELVRNPKIALFPQLVATAELLRTLLAQSKSPNVHFALEHPHYIWITRNPMPPDFEANSTKFGKWVINTTTIVDSVAIVTQLLPHFANGKLGTVKFELRPHGDRLTVVVYAQDHDPAVFKLVRQAADRAPFWVTDEFCYEAEGIGALVQTFVAKIDLKKTWNPALAKKLKDRAFCESRGISPIQAEILWRLLNPNDPRNRDTNTDYAHVINGYFGGDEELAAEVSLGSDRNAKFIDTLRHVLLFAFDNNQRKTVRQLLEAQRSAFLRRYRK